MSDLELSLDPRELVRVHRSYFVRPAAVVETEHAGRNQFALVLITGARVEIGRSYAERLKQQFPGLGKRSSRKVPRTSGTISQIVPETAICAHSSPLGW